MVDADLLRAVAPMPAGATPESKRDTAPTPARRLPTDILDRPKTGLSIPVRGWLVSGDTEEDERSDRYWAPTFYWRYREALMV